MRETVRATGHEHVRATHASTFEVTTEPALTPAGDCILAVAAHRGPVDFDESFKTACRDAAATVTVVLAAGEHLETVTGRGDPDLTFASPTSLVGRTSEYVDDRTVLVDADTAAADIDRDLVTALSDGASLTATLEVG